MLRKLGYILLKNFTKVELRFFINLLNRVIRFKFFRFDNYPSINTHFVILPQVSFSSKLDFSCE